MPTFSSVVHKPGRRVAAPKARPRRSVQLSMTESVPPTTANKPASGSQTEPPKISQGPPDAPPAVIRKPEFIINTRQTRQKTASDNVQEKTKNAPLPVLSTRPPPPAAIPAATQARAFTTPFPASPFTAALTKSNAFPSSLPQPPPRGVASRKRNSGEVEDSTQEAIHLTNGGLTSHVTPDTALPSVEMAFMKTSLAKPKRAAPRPCAQPRPGKPAQTHTDKNAMLSRTQRTPRSASVRPSATSRAQSTAQTEADALLQNITSQFSAVSRLADGIDGTSRAAIVARSGANTQDTTKTNAILINALNRAVHRQRQARNAEDLASEIIGEVTGEEVSEKPKRKRRRKTPDDAEEHVIDPTETKMGDLTRDTGLGKKSGIELALQNIDWKAVKQQKKEKEEAAHKKEQAERAEKRSGKPKKRKTQKETRAEALVPDLEVVNGVIQAVAESREIDIRQGAEAEAARQDTTVLTVDKLTTRTNQNTVGKPRGLTGKPLRWSDEMEARFYKGIRMFGADMSMVSSLFPGIERRHIKHKFVREERANAARLREALFNPMPVNAETFQEETGMELGDPRKLDEELKAMEADLRKRFEDQMAEQQAGTHPVEIDDADIAIPSREQGSVEPPAGTIRSRGGRENRFNAVADDIVNEAMGSRPSGLKKSKKKAASGGRKKKDGSAAIAPRKGSKAAKQAQALLQLGGTVEEIGTVDEVPR